MEKEVISTSAEHNGLKPTADERARLRDETQAIIDALTSPAYVAALKAVKEAPTKQRLQEAAKRLTPEALRAEGVPLPKGMRISSRYFESDMPKPLEFGDLPDGKENPLNKLATTNPGLLDDLRINNPPALSALLSDTNANLAAAASLPQAKIGGCTCGGVNFHNGTACGGAGYYL